MDTALCLLVFYLSTVAGLKILMFQTAAGHSHMQFSGALIDVLADAGHEVHLLTAEWNPAVSSDGTTRAASSRRIRTASNITGLTQMAHLKDPFKMTPWGFLIDYNQRKLFENLMIEFCQLIVKDDQLLQWIRSQKFDAVLTAMYGSCQYGLFYKAGIRPVMGFLATPASNYILSLFGIDTPSSYTKDTSLSLGHSDEMNYFERALNFLVQNIISYYVMPSISEKQQELWNDKYGPSFPSLKELMSKTTYVFVNTNEFTEFPRPISYKIIYVGGIGVRKPKKVNKYYDELLSLRKGTVLFSFGSLARTALMPKQMMIAFLEAFISFPDYTFIWKTDEETMRDELFSHYPNVQLVKWMPQNDLLSDGRISLFITHAGLNSLEEAVHAGVPMITIPLFGDQMHNAAVAEKRGIAYPLSKWNITKEGVISALNAVLSNKSYATSARTLMEMTKNKPMHNVNKTFLEYVEFAAQYKSVGDNLQLHAVNLNVFQLYCIDLITPALFIIAVLLFIMFKITLIAINELGKRIAKLKME